MKSSPESDAKANDDNNSITSTDERLPTSRFVLFFAIVVVGLSADLITKSIVLTKYPPVGMEPVWGIDNMLGIQTSLNGGALFGIGQGHSFWFALFSVVALAAILFWMFVKKLARNLWLTIVLGMVSGGILGNLYDRVGLGYDPAWNNPDVRGHVRDWIHFRWEGIGFLDPWPNFNIADSLLVCGACMLFVLAIVGIDSPSKSGNSESED